MNSKKNHSIIRAVAICVMSAFAVAGCNNSGNSHAAGQALAKVNGYEITVHEVNELLSKVPPGAASDPAKLQARALEALIDRQLLVAKATEAKLDRNPDVMQAIAAARQELLAQAYLRSVVSQTAGDESAGVKEYYDKNPQLFANRKQYQMHQLTLPASSASEDLAKVVESSESVDQVAAWLQSKGIKFDQAVTERATTDFPPQILQNLDQLVGKKLFVIKQPGRQMIASLTFKKDIPVALAEAAPEIQRFLVNKNVGTTAAAELKRLRAAAKIDYVNGAPGAAVTAAAPAPESHIAAGAAGLK